MSMHKLIIINLGVGSSCVYPLLGATVNQWKFVATDISQKAINEARENVKANSLDMSIDVVHNKQPDAIFKV
jgi:23S rRNA A1618 N6-methylase RlmF